jgi:hypothetical protein
MPSVAPEPATPRAAAQKPKARRSRKDPDDRRADLVRAARLLFSRAGYVDLMLDGQIDADTAFRVTTGYAGAHVAP